MVNLAPLPQALYVLPYHVICGDFWANFGNFGNLNFIILARSKRLKICRDIQTNSRNEYNFQELCSILRVEHIMPCIHETDFKYRISMRQANLFSIGISEVVSGFNRDSEFRSYTRRQTPYRRSTHCRRSKYSQSKL